MYVQTFKPPAVETLVQEGFIWRPRLKTFTTIAIFLLIAAVASLAIDVYGNYKVMTAAAAITPASVAQAQIERRVTTHASFANQSNENNAKMQSVFSSMTPEQRNEIPKLADATGLIDDTLKMLNAGQDPWAKYKTGELKAVGSDWAGTDISKPLIKKSGDNTFISMVYLAPGRGMELTFGVFRKGADGKFVYNDIKLTDGKTALLSKSAVSESWIPGAIAQAFPEFVVKENLQ